MRAFLLHRAGWYPQLLQNALSGTVVGISFDQALYNFIGFACYSAFNCALFFNTSVQRQYRHTSFSSSRPCMHAYACPINANATLLHAMRHSRSHAVLMCFMQW